MIRRAFRQLAALLVLAFVPAAISGALQLVWRKETPLGIHEVRPGTARLWGEYVVWVDARPRSEFGSQHVPGAILLNREGWDDQVPKLLAAWDSEKAIVVYDGGENEGSIYVAERLRAELKLESVYVLKGGWRAWQRE